MLSAEADVRGARRDDPGGRARAGGRRAARSGDRVPADLRLAARRLRIDEAALTGESVPAAKSSDPVAPECDRRRSRGHGVLGHHGRRPAGATGVVVATGSDTEIGRINQLLVA